MLFKKSALTVALSFFLAASSYAETDSWSEVAGETNQSAWGAEVIEEPAAVELAPVAAAKVESSQPQAACGDDDPRYGSLITVIKDLQAGNSIEPMQTSISTYVSLSENVRKVLGENFYISGADCSKNYMFEGELIGNINMPFNEIWALINEALRTNDPVLINILRKNVRANPDSAFSVVSMAQPVSLDDDQARKLNTLLSLRHTAADAVVLKPLLLEIFTAFGGIVNADDKGKIAFVYVNDNYVENVKGIYMQGQKESLVPALTGEITEGRKTDTAFAPRVSAALSAAGLNSQVSSQRNAVNEFLKQAK